MTSGAAIQKKKTRAHPSVSLQAENKKMLLCWPTWMVGAHSVACAALRGFGLELQVREAQWRWVARTCWRLAVVSAMDSTLSCRVSKRKSLLRIAVAVCGIAASYWHNVVGPAPKVERLRETGTILVTGATAGIGRATAVALVRQGCVVVVPARDAAKAEATARAITKEARSARGLAFAVPGADLELSSQESARNYAAALRRELKRSNRPPLSTIVLNAGTPNPLLL